ncbi:helix-turn-helix domain containing protein [Mycobacterium sp. CVI_P3]|uniref:Helix-turn-helix domain containing protein n=1 Tax=Mycobacterium pinniadriaticum TaxID=2994102 RepID=A0ABT3S9S6_9MYCO|nr:TetR/AcrR family transcriptional regulator [Mycobacterium pinniadriaticum]MCX2930085.1 helix-turn-helix domain containing protein [Mycobacterium pinniadriaticum]MCX2936266.1 helix-turn-helix domain containing protein [Mycobacterium pinniadriaticum]
MADAEPTGPRARRGPREVQDLVLKAADRLFTSQGYHGTTTRQIAEEAGVGEPVIFRNFGSKAGLFEQATLRPFTEFLTNWVSSWEREQPATTNAEKIVRSFVTGFYGVVDEHRELIKTLISARAQGGDQELDRVSAAVSDKVAEALRIMRRALLDHGEPRHYDRLDPPLTVAVSAGAVMSVLLLDDWLFPSRERRPSRKRQIDELTQMLLHGIAHRQTPPP